MGNLALRRKKRVSTFRKMAIGTWRTAYDPTVYGSISLRMEKAEDYLERFRAATGRRLTINHLIARALAAVLEDMPDANAILRWNRIYLRERIGVFFQVAFEDPTTGEIDLSGVTVYDPEAKSLLEIIDEFERSAALVRKGKDTKEKSRNLVRMVPYALVNSFFKLMSFLSYTLNLNLRWLGVPRDPFGSVMVTNIGSIGLEEAYAPLVPYSRVPIVIALGAISDQPVVDDDRVIPGRVMRVCAAIDHRILDGAHVARMVRTVREWIENPDERFGPPPAAAAAADAGEQPAATG